MFKRRFPVAIYLLLLAVALPGRSSAQADTARSRAGQAPITLQSLEVSVSRFTVPTSRLPFAIWSTTPTAAVLGGATSADAALRGVPGVQVANRYNDAVGERITIRGMGARAQFGIRGIRVLIDGIPATMPDGQTTLTHLDASAVTSTQVLRGPAGALWGNASGGVIQMTTAPLAQETELRIDRGSFGLHRASIAARENVTANASVYGRVTVHDYEGFKPHSLSNKVLVSGGGDWTASVSDRLWFAVHVVDYEADNPGSLSQRQLDSARFQANPNNVRQHTGENGTHLELGGGWSHLLGAASLQITGYGIYRDLTNPIPPTIIDLTRNAGGARVVLATASDARVIVTAGAEAGLQSDDRANHANNLGGRGDVTLDQKERVRYLAPFAQAVLALTDNIDAVTALRYDTYRFRADDRLVSTTDPDDSGTRNMNAPSATAGVRARIGRASVYGNYATSFQTPTTTELANRPDGAGGFNPVVQPERTHGGEIGAALQIDGLQVQAAAYMSKVRDALVAFEVPGAASRQYFRNASAVTNRGVELGAHLGVNAFSVSGALSTTSSHFDDYTVGDVSYAGNRVPGIADASADLSVGWHTTRNAAAGVSLRYSGSVAANDANTARAPSFVLLDADVAAPEVRIGRVGIRVGAGVSNIADVAYITSVSINAAGARYFEPGPGRAFFVRVSAGR
jgi:iron complex outermembrane receptor protein